MLIRDIILFLVLIGIIPIACRFPYIAVLMLFPVFLLYGLVSVLYAFIPNNKIIKYLNKWTYE